MNMISDVKADALRKKCHKRKDYITMEYVVEKRMMVEHRGNLSSICTIDMTYGKGVIRRADNRLFVCNIYLFDSLNYDLHVFRSSSEKKKFSCWVIVLGNQLPMPIIDPKTKRSGCLERSR